MVLLVSAGASAQTSVNDWLVDRFDEWQVTSFEGETHYQLDKKQNIVKAIADGSASGLILKGPFDLDKTPWLEWQWRLQTLPNTVNETNKAGDDFAARVYVIIEGRIFRWRGRAINYVWSNKHPQGRICRSPFAPKNVTLLSLQSGSERKGIWLTERRNVQIDLHAAFGKRFDKIDAIAIMTDADNSQTKAAADYRQLRLVAE